MPRVNASFESATQSLIKTHVFDIQLKLMQNNLKCTKKAILYQDQSFSGIKIFLYVCRLASSCKLL